MKRALFTSLLGLIATVGYSQISTTTGLTATQYVNDVLLGNGVTASNITYTGYPLGISQFSAPGSTNLGFSNGVFLTTGSSEQFDPNNLASIGLDGPAGPSPNLQSLAQSPMYMNDHDLHVLLYNIGYDTTNFIGIGPGLTNDIAVLEFDFIPTSDTISFRYRFASEEYNDFVNDPSDPNVPVSVFNDIFAFLLKGVSPAAVAQYPSYENIALIPNTNIPVSIFTVNNGYSIDGVASTGPCTNCAYYVDNLNTVVDVVYDGMTTVLTAKAPVLCGEKYHIKLTIADVGDQAWDSGVFIEAGSFSSPGVLQVASEIGGDPNNHTFVEGCNSGSVTLTRETTSGAQNFQVVYGGNGSATSDFNGLPNSVNFSAGQSTAQINLQAIADGLTEGNETFSVGFIIPSPCGNTMDTLTINFNITDLGTMDVNAGNDIVNCNSSAINQTITPVVTGGSGNITYSWNVGGNTPSYTVTTAGQYIVTVTDQCNQTASDTVLAIVSAANPLSVSLVPDFNICPNTPVSLQATPSGGSGNITYAWSNGAINNSVQLIPATTTSLSVTASDACGQTATDNIIISVVDVTANFTYVSDANGMVNFTDLSNPNSGLNYLWDFGDGQTSTEQNPQHSYTNIGEYVVTLTVSNAQGCEDVTVQKLIFEITSEVFIPNAFTPSQDGVNDTWRISISYLEDFKLYVFDRWGQLVFQTDDLYDQWDGTFFNNKKPLKCDRYVYRIIYTEYKGDEKEIYGSVTLLK